MLKEVITGIVPQYVSSFKIKLICGCGQRLCNIYFSLFYTSFGMETRSRTHFILSLSFISNEKFLHPLKKITFFPFSILCLKCENHCSMVPNVDLILLALLHGSVISCIVLLVTFVIFICLLLAFSIILLLIVFIDFYDAVSFISWYLAIVKSNIELAFMVTLFTLMRFIVNMSLASMTFLEGTTINLKVKMQLLRGQNM